MRTIDCPAITKPKVEKRPTLRYGLPVAGTTGQNTAINSVLLHCVPDIEGALCNDKPALHRDQLTLRTSYHYLISIDGKIFQDVDDESIAWGLSPQVELGTSNITYECGLFSSFVAPPTGQPLDAGKIHIALERPAARILKADPDFGTCDCEGGALEAQFGKAQRDALIRLLTYLTSEYMIQLDANHINWRHNIDLCDRQECGCDPCVTEIFCAVEAYCGAVSMPCNPAVKAGVLEYIYGDDNTCNQVAESFEGFKARLGITAPAPTHPAVALTNNAAPFSGNATAQTWNIPQSPTFNFNPTTGVLTLTPGNGVAATTVTIPLAFELDPCEIKAALEVVDDSTHQAAITGTPALKDKLQDFAMFDDAGCMVSFHPDATCQDNYIQSSHGLGWTADTGWRFTRFRQRLATLATTNPVPYNWDYDRTSFLIINGTVNPTVVFPVPPSDCQGLDYEIVTNESTTITFQAPPGHVLIPISGPAANTQTYTPAGGKRGRYRIVYSGGGSDWHVVRSNDD